MKLLRITLLACLAAIILPALARADPITLTDTSGRTVTLAKPAKRIVLEQGRLISALALLDPDPVGLLAGWSRDFQKLDPDTYRAYLARFPKIAEVPVVGDGSPGSLSAESIIALNPDLVVLSPSSGGKEAELMQTLEAAGIPAVSVDFFYDPLKNTVPGMRLLGAATGRSEQAEAFLALYRSHMDHVAEVLAAHPGPRPDVFIHAHAGGYTCCYSAGRATFGQYIEFAGGHNIAADALKGSNGQLSLEYVLSRNPAVYIATGGAYIARKGGIAVGTGFSPEKAQGSLVALLADPGLHELGAVKQGRAFGLWQFFNDTPLNVVAVEAMAKWIHPELFADLQPEKTLDEINRRFLTVPLQGAFWTEAPPARP